MLLDARPVRDKKIEELKNRVNNLQEKPELALIRVGNDPASEKYVNNKIKMCNLVGVKSEVYHLKEDITQEELEFIVNLVNSDENTTGILVQLPLPKHLDENRILKMIDPKKEVDGFCNENIGKLVRGEKAPIACTPKGIISLLKEYNISIEGKDVLIINRSNIVGKPLAHLFLKENATVTIAHSKTKNLKDKIYNSDIVVTAVGRANMFDHNDFKEGTTIIDVSINVNEDGKLCGDVRKDSYVDILAKQCNITPVPNGVGVMTVLSLIEQVIEMKEDNK
ncbi:MAG: bifunctional 5,10-methylenetetrahydrofolate dehydrogenase/5,10-methenyltetrahydrofolate cyclohydrolase [Peptostreptococcaceae bacterium]|nr:bifunctional 5,10-methylenetetrahydrofolate dehydrogenase/5,10-methenyltetrahydrofolate cyclohydrolase [Peptostreptococcaceae bacterium]MBP3931082.1 bifunctional 5,10-methylenetetrahydrofolate dehydrogenase/5,10-methenyltetrahydrofolate cyclohydrolase [Peptostreptococcaceae bacterium]